MRNQTLPPGPELDELVKDRLMHTISAGIKWTDANARYSTDMRWAWQIVEKLAPIVGDFPQADGFFFLQYADSACHERGKNCDPGPGETDEAGDEDLSKWSCHFHPGHPGADTEAAKLFPNYKKSCARGRTAAHAICLAALKVVEEPKKRKRK